MNENVGSFLLQLRRRFDSSVSWSSSDLAEMAPLLCGSSLMEGLTRESSFSPSISPESAP
ncbi:hypothetical protein HPP92_004724 [Vanilla planifolia]|uniref:Uncharacterized protein n=1 Tax=Vanilla planifolia TaxID=51239 RepID=A0A835RMA7_VANPL|nr:hypothetical protein HPP92_005082 [Vanilla planifolia]KAG0493730.1 hypothetical protein HPP92_004724 [Vanilla planifolia]